MAGCRWCGGRFATGPSTFPGFNVLACVDCGRPIKLIPLTGPRVPSHRPKRGEDARALRAARRSKLREETP